jgi:gliding motility-associated-like protein/uncharacterized delta-60 repeat protein
MKRLQINHLRLWSTDYLSKKNSERVQQEKTNPTGMFATQTRFVLAIVVCILNTLIFAQSGANDPTFNSGTGINDGIGRLLLKSTILSDGKILIGGYFQEYNGTTVYNFARLNSNGSFDSTFNLGTGLDGSPKQMVIQPDGKILLVGDFTSYNGTSRLRIARLNQDGTLDISFNPGTGANLNVNALALQVDGKIIIGGEFTTYNGTSVQRIVRLNSDGTLDNTFNPGTGPGPAMSNAIGTINIQTDGKIIISGQFTTFNGTSISKIARLNPDGTLDASFNPGTGPGGGGLIEEAVLHTDGKLIIGGSFSSYNGTNRNFIARLNTDGSLDTSFDPGTGANIYVHSVGLLPNGKIIIAGSFTSFNGTSRPRIARLNPDGTLDTTFDPGTGANLSIYDATIQPDGRIIIVGNFSSYNGVTRAEIARILGDCTPISSTTSISACNSYTVPSGDETYTTSQIVNDTIPAANGCDSIITINLTINNSSSSTATVSACASYTWPLNGITYTSSTNTPKDTLMNVAGCDSIVTLNLTINNNSGIDVQEHCETYTWIDGNTYTANNNTATHTLTNVAGCDSVVTLNLTIKNASSSIDTQTVCDTYTWIDGNVYTSSNNTATHTLTNAVGCDSVVTLNLTVNNSSILTDFQTACDSLTWRNGITYYTSNNTASDTVFGVAAHGCDSIYILNLTIYNSTSSAITIDTCQAFVLNNQLFTTSGSYTQVIPNAAGCDSNISITAIIAPLTTSIFIDTCSAVLVNSQLFASSGTFTQTLTNSYGCDSILTINLTITPITGSLTLTNCGSMNINGQIFNASGTYTQVLTASNGCDSTLTINLTIVPLPTLTASITNPGVYCENEAITLTASGADTYSWDNGITNGVAFLPAAGVNLYIVTGTANGCTSTLQVPVTVGSKPIIEATASSSSVCEFDSIYFSGNGALIYNYLTPDFAYAEWFYPNQLGSSTYLMEGIGVNGCRDTVSITIELRDRPLAPNASAFADSTCYGHELSPAITAIPVSGVIEWFTDEKLMNSLEVNNTLDEDENMTGITSYYASDFANNCYSPGTEVQITVFALPDVYAGPEVVSLAHETVTLSGTVSNTVDYYWTNTLNSLVDSALSFSFLTTASGEYTLHAISADGCMDSSKVLITINKPFVSSNYVSANGDGNNDTWQVHPIEKISGCTVRIFNTFGQIIFESDNYKNDWSGNDLPDGDYYFEISCEWDKTVGSITLIH